MVERYFLGVDLGGTSVKTGLVDEHGKILGRAVEPTGPVEASTVIAAMVRAGQNAVAAAGRTMADVTAIGIVAPGQANLQRGVVHRAANFPLWEDVPLRAQVTRALGVPGMLENDANAAAFGEYWAGAGKGKNFESLAILTLGTGLGGGLIQKGRVFHGAGGVEMEVGHTILIPDGEPCGCGQHGCAEVYCSGEYTARRAMRALRETQQDSTLRPAMQSRGAITAADVATAAAAGDELAIGIWDDMCKFVALAAINCIHVIDPNMLVLGGGISKAGPLLLNGVLKHLHARWWRMTPQTCQIVLATLAGDAGVVGAAGVARGAFAHNELPAAGT